MKKKTKQQELQETEAYVAFLDKRLKSQHYKDNVPKEVFEGTKKKYESAKLRLRCLKNTM